MRKGGTKLSRTIRKRYTGALVRDGQWTHRCPEPNCDWCVRGRAKRVWNRWKRQEAKDWERIEELGSDEEIAEAARYLVGDEPSAPLSTTPGFVSQYIEDSTERRAALEAYTSRLNVHY